MGNRLVTSWALIAFGASTLIFAAVGPSYEWFSTDVTGELTVLAAFLLVMGYLVGALERARRRRPGVPLPREVRDERLIDRTVRGLAGGVLTAVFFLFFYRVMDFPYDLSERHVDGFCQPLGWPPFAPAPEAVVQSRPVLVALIPEFVLTGVIIGLLVGHMVPYWRQLWRRVVARNRDRPVLASPWLSYPLFGLLSGVSLGAVFNVFIFAKSDGRPFLRLLTAVFAASVSVVAYVAIEAYRNRNSSTSSIIYDLISVAIGAFIFAGVFYMADSGLHISAWTYCHFYSAWDTRFNHERITPMVLFVAGAYGGILGVVVMMVVAAYSYVSSLHGADLPGEQA